MRASTSCWLVHRQARVHRRVPVFCEFVREAREPMRGVNLTEAAYSAGFSDAAHISELVRRRQSGRAAFVQSN